MNLTDEMTAGEFIDLMYSEYGDEFNWCDPPKKETFVRELITELGEDDPFVLNRSVTIAAKCESCDDMLFCSVGEDGSELWRIYHITWSRRREKEGWPRRTDFPCRRAALEHIRDEFVKDYL